MTFRSIVLIVATIILIILLASVAYLLKNQKIGMLAKMKWPPHVSNCPDFWKEKLYSGSEGDTDVEKQLNICNVKKEGNDNAGNIPGSISGPNICINEFNLGKPLVNEMDFNKDKFTGDKGICAKQKWAREHNLTWDGVTNKVLENC